MVRTKINPREFSSETKFLGQLILVIRFVANVRQHISNFKERITFINKKPAHTQTHTISKWSLIRCMCVYFLSTKHK